jgi:hypothetical protein
MVHQSKSLSQGESMSWMGFPRLCRALLLSMIQLNLIVYRPANWTFYRLRTLTHTRTLGRDDQRLKTNDRAMLIAILPPLVIVLPEGIVRQ